MAGKTKQRNPFAPISEEKIKRAIAAANRVTVEMAAQQEREQFAERLATLRKNARLTQKQLAEKAGMDRALIVRYETAKSMPRQKAIEKLAAALDVAPAALDVSGNAGSYTVVDTAMLRKHGYNARKVQHGLYVVSMPGCPEVTITDKAAQNLWEYCYEETGSAFSEVMESYFVHLFIREVYADYAERTAPDQDGSEPK